MQLTISQIAAFSQAQTVVAAADPQTTVEQLAWDSRKLQPDLPALFIALPGESTDGNNFLIEALNNGAAAVIATRPPTEAERQAARLKGAALLQAEDGQAALQRLATHYRDTLSARVIGITGSSGKTSTRLYVCAVLEQAFSTVASQANHNNEIGLPATVLAASPHTEALIVEMAMRGLGQIADLCEIAQPQLGIITNIGPAHLELLGSMDNIARAKAELIEALPNTSGIAILNGDDPYTPQLRQTAQTQQRGIPVILFGLALHNDIRAEHIAYDNQGNASFDLWFLDAQPRRVQLQAPGRHSIYNALAAAATGVALGLQPQQIVAALEQVSAAPMRQTHYTLTDGTLLIDDTYNANPDSMAAALDVLSHLDPARPHIAVLGDMGELGARREELHAQVGAAAWHSGIDVLLTMGELAKHYAQGAKQAGMDASAIIGCTRCEEAARALAPYREAEPKPIILVKASRFMGLERLIALLKETD
ncbi:MAG: UDP-N-acetylmuramoyl-tripeptide--D-alanyl-D-alanine ligase [Coriobacteriia bacterium]|nr:UDP-N-acetylmuramoyl-tripeptide--D-alanyl-D-alanine ligase [Coriobacteriia bacterium]